MVAEVVYSSNIQKLLGNAYLVTQPSSMQLYYGMRPRAPPGHVLSFDPFAKQEIFSRTGDPSFDAFVRHTEIRDRYTGVDVKIHSPDPGHLAPHIDMNSWVLNEKGSNFDHRRFGSSGEELTLVEQLAATNSLLKERLKMHGK